MITPKIVSEPKWKSYIVKSLTPIFTPYECKEIIEIGNKLPQLDANIGLGKTSQDHSKRKTDIAWIPFDKMPDKYEILDDWGMKINNNHFGFDPLPNILKNIITTGTQIVPFSLMYNPLLEN